MKILKREQLHQQESEKESEGHLSFKTLLSPFHLVPITGMTGAASRWLREESSF